jgi:hypothetical protein
MMNAFGHETRCVFIFGKNKGNPTRLSASMMMRISPPGIPKAYRQPWS